MARKTERNVRAKPSKSCARAKHGTQAGKPITLSESLFSNRNLLLLTLLLGTTAIVIYKTSISDKQSISSSIQDKKKSLESPSFLKPPQRNGDYDAQRGIDRRSNLSLEEFVELYDAKWPVLITDAMKSWPAMKKWSKNFFMKNYGEERITFKGVHGSINDRQGLSSALKVFLEHIHMSSRNMWTYLEDEIFLLKHRELLADFDRPIYLKEDFFALLPEEVRPWNAMLLWGTQFSRSTLHIDPYNWTGTNAVLKGRKAWKLYPPGQDHLLYVKDATYSGFPLECYKYNSPVDAFDVDESAFPLMKSAKVVEFVQYPGEFLIIPTGWFHQAYNEEETLAISSQVMNSQNFRHVLEEILKVDNIRSENIPTNLEGLQPKEQVKKIFAKLPKEVIEQGKRVTRDILRKLNDKEHTKLHFH